MSLEFSNNFCAACEPVAWIWHKGNDAIGRHPIAIIVVVDVHLPEIHTTRLNNSPEHLHDNHSTHSVGSIEDVIASNKVVSTRKNACSAHVEIPKVERFRMRE